MYRAYPLLKAFVRRILVVDAPEFSKINYSSTSRFTAQSSTSLTFKRYHFSRLPPLTTPPIRHAMQRAPQSAQGRYKKRTKSCQPRDNVSNHHNHNMTETPQTQTRHYKIMRLVSSGVEKPTRLEKHQTSPEKAVPQADKNKSRRGTRIDEQRLRNTNKSYQIGRIVETDTKGGQRRALGERIRSYEQ